MDISAGVEQPVVFGAGEAPTGLFQSEFWPNS